MGRMKELWAWEQELKEAERIAREEALMELASRDPREAAAKAVTKTQVGGNHYLQIPISPWEIIKKNNLDFFEGNALKYLLRYKYKGGIEDLEKAKHYIDAIITNMKETK